MDDTRMEVERILKVLDDCARVFTFPMLDNGYVFPAAARLNAFADGTDWALVLETFGYSPRTGVPDLTVQTYGGHLRRQRSPSDFVTRDAYLRYLDQHPFNEFATYQPIAAGSWAIGEIVSPRARAVRVRGRRVDLPTMAAYAVAGIERIDPDVVSVADLTRYLAETERDAVLGTDDERRTHVPVGLPEVLRLDDWHHPDLADGRLPSDTECFRLIAEVLADGDGRWYEPTEPPNTDWRNWPDGGRF